jgi:hypothetical protein
MCVSLVSAGGLFVASPAAAGPLALVIGGATALVAWIFLSTRYVVENGRLDVRSGPFRWRVPIDAISRIERTRNPLSSPALSLDRLAIEYDGKRLMISPLDRAGFLDAIKRAQAGPPSTSGTSP